MYMYLPEYNYKTIKYIKTIFNVTKGTKCHQFKDHFCGK